MEFIMKPLYLVFLSLIVSVFGGKEVDVMRTLSKKIGNVVLQCQNEMGFNSEVIRDFLLFWKKSHVFSTKDLGCALACVFRKLDLMEPGGSIITENTVHFTNFIGADAKTGTHIMKISQSCVRTVQKKRIDDGCMSSLEIAKCFRSSVLDLNWAPPEDELLLMQNKVQYDEDMQYF